MVPERPTTMGDTQGTLWAPHKAQMVLKSRSPEGKVTSPGIQNHPLGAPWVPRVLLLLSLSLLFFLRVFFCVVPVLAAVFLLLSLF